MRKTTALSNYKSVAVVTAALKNRLTAVCEAALSGASITTVRPDISGSGLPTKGANLFLYQVTPNAAQRNADLTTRRPDGSVIRHPTAAIDLHYLMSFYGDDSAFETQILLGSVLSNLHAKPALSREEIQQVFSASALGSAGAGGAATPGDPAIAELKVAGQPQLLDPSGLADAVDLVRFTPTALSLEELSKLWSVFLDTPYVLSVIYQAGPVLIQDTSDQLTAGALPVMLPAQIEVMASGPPSITQVLPSGGAGQPIVTSSTLSLAGSFYPGAVTTILIDGAVVQQVTLPAALPAGQPPITGVAIPATLASGAHGIQVVQQLATGLKSGPSSSPMHSAVAGFVLQPSITSTSVAAGSSTRDVTVVVAPPVAAHQTVSLLLNLLTPAAANPFGAYQLAIQAPQSDGVTSFVFATKGQPSGDLPAGTYLARIQIDGVASPLTFVPPPLTGTATGPTGFTAPQIVLA